MAKARTYQVEALTTEPNQARAYAVEVTTEVGAGARARVYAVEVTTEVVRRRVYAVEVETEVILTANAGPDQTVESLTRVYLSGLASGGDPVTWSWSQTGGTAVTLEPSAEVPTPSFVAPATDAGDVVTFELTVGDGLGGVSDVSDAVTITVRPHTTWAYTGGAWRPYLIDDNVT